MLLNQYSVFYEKEVSQHVVLHFTEVFNRMNTPEDFTWRKELSSTTSFIKIIRLLWMHLGDGYKSFLHG